MSVKKFIEFINEAKDDGECSAQLLDLFKKKPEVKMTTSFWPTEKGIYSMGGISNFLNKKFKASPANCLGSLIKSNKIECIKIKNYHYNETYPYYYMGLTEDQAEKIKKEYEDYSKLHGKKVVKKSVPQKTVPIKKSSVERKPGGPKSKRKQ